MYLEMLERQVSERENTSDIFGNISIVNSVLLKKAVDELKAARKVVELAKAKPTLCGDRLKALGEAIKEYEKFGGENVE